VYVTGMMTMHLLSLTVNPHLQQVCVGRSDAADVICYNSSGSQMSSLSTAGVSVFAVSYNFLSGLHSFFLSVVFSQAYNSFFGHQLLSPTALFFSL